MSPLEQYLQELRDIRATGAAVKETSYYAPLANFLNEIGSTLKPKVRCLMQLKNLGAGMPDGGLFTARQFQRALDDRPNDPQNPERGVIEVKGTGDDAWVTASSQQVSKYWDKYRQVLVTNYRDFVLIGQDKNGQPITIETYRLANSEKEFWQKIQKPRIFAQEQEEQLTEYLKRVMLQQAAIATPQDLAWFLASYAKDARARIEKFDLPALQTIRTGLEGALGITFTAQKGEHFFKSTLIQTLFYGVFSAWVLWHKQGANNEYFDWKTAAWSLHVPMVKALFEKVATPSHLGRLDLVEVLDWTGEALNRVDRVSFFAQFDEGLAVQYFYEPFLEAFDPQLRKDLGVWYTPPEIVKYMVARVDTVLKKELGITAGLADENVYILDPCCGTGAFLVEVLKSIHQTLSANGEDALTGSALKEAAKNRVFGFEILTAPFVVAHLQLGVLLQNFGVPLQDETERVGIYLTNALTGWQPPNEEAKKRIQQLELLFPELEKEREAADEVKRGKPILVILGNPPYNAYAGTSPAEEEGLVEVYKEGLIKDWGIKKFNLDDLYVRFFRLAERCISEHTTQGVVCYVSNYSWVSEPSFVVLRQHLLESFDKFWIENMHGNRKISEYAPDGKTSETIFAIRGFSVGIQQGVVISLWVKNNQNNQTQVLFQNNINAAKAGERRQQLLNTLNNQDFDAHYQPANPHQNNRFSFRPSVIKNDYLEWPKLTDLCAIDPFQGLDEDRGFELIDIDKDKLITRMQAYFNKATKWDDLKLICKRLTQDSAMFIAEKAREKVTSEEKFLSERILKYDLRILDKRWCYYTAINPLWKRPRPSLWEQFNQGNNFILSRAAGVAKPEGIPFFFTKNLFARDCMRGHAVGFPIFIYPTYKINKKSDELFNTNKFITNTSIKANLSPHARQYLTDLQFANLDEDGETASLIWYHALAIGYSPLYLTENADGIRQDFPRIPLPKSQALLLKSAQLGQQVAQLLDTENPSLVNQSLANLKQIAVISHANNQQLNPDAGDLTINVGWGHGGKQGVTMPGKGKLIERVFSDKELTYFQQNLQLNSEKVNQLLGNVTYDIYLNEIAYWKNIPQRIWDYTIGGYQVIKKWLSYREFSLLGRPLKLEEVREVQDMARRITAILLLETELNANYEAIKQATFSWPNSSHTSADE